MFQFADIAVPGVERKFLAGAVRQLDRGLVILLAEAGDEKFCKGDDVFGPLAQRGYLEMYRVDAVQQVLAEFAFCHHLGQIAVCSANQPYVYGNGSVAAYTDNAAALDGGQQFGLQMVGEIAYFIEKEGAAAGCFELAGTVGMGIGERAFHVAEQFAFEKAFGDCTHIHTYHVLPVAR